MKKITLCISVFSTFINVHKAISVTDSSSNNQTKIEVAKTPDIQEVQNQQAVESLKEYIKIQAARQEELARKAHEILNQDISKEVQSASNPK